MDNYDNLEHGQRVSVVVPAFNEGECIGAIVTRIFAVNPSFEVIVVDDGSSDDTAAKAAEAKAHVIRHPRNLGNGASIKHGSRVATGDVVVFMDADGQHPPEEIPKLLSKIPEYDMVVGARTRNSKTALIRNVGNFALTHIAQWISGCKIDDLTSGFRAVKREQLLEFVHLFPRRYSYPTTITLAMLLSGYFVHYEPLDSIKRRESGASNISPIRDFFRFLQIIFRIIILFSPQRVFVPLSVVMLLLSFLVGGYQYVVGGGIRAAGLAFFLSSIYIGCFGLLADQIALLRRERHCK